MAIRDRPDSNRDIELLVIVDEHTKLPGCDSALSVGKSTHIHCVIYNWCPFSPTLCPLELALAGMTSSSHQRSGASWQTTDSCHQLLAPVIAPNRCKLARCCPNTALKVREQIGWLGRGRGRMRRRGRGRVRRRRRNRAYARAHGVRYP